MTCYQHLKLWPQTFAICKLSADAKIPDWCPDKNFVNITRTDDELSIICEEQFVPQYVKASKDWKMLQVVATMDLSLVGILSKITSPLAEAGISIFAMSTYDTDYLLIQKQQSQRAIRVLFENGYKIT